MNQENTQNQYRFHYSHFWLGGFGAFITSTVCSELGATLSLSFGSTSGSKSIVSSKSESSFSVSVFSREEHSKTCWLSVSMNPVKQKLQLYLSTKEHKKSYT